MTSTQTDNLSSLLQEFRLEADTKSPSTATAYHQAIRLFAAYHGLPYPFFTYLCLNGYTPKTALHYNNIISSLLKKSRLEEHQPGKRSPSPKAQQPGKHSPSPEAQQPGKRWPSPAAPDDAGSDKTPPPGPGERRTARPPQSSGEPRKSRVAADWEALAVPGQARSKTPLNPQFSILNFKFQNAADPLIQTSLLNGALPISRLVSLRISDLPSLTPQTRDLLARIVSPKRKYIFPLNQSLLTPKQVRDKVETDLRASLRSLKIPIIGNVDETLRTIWTITALRLGHSPAEILSVIPHVPLGTPWMPDERSEKHEATDTNLFIEEVGAALFNNPEEWFAMRLRPKVTFSQLTDRLSSIWGAQNWEAQAVPGQAHASPRAQSAELVSAAARAAIPAKPLLFYPYEEIAKRIGKKIEIQQKPVIRDIVFFRTRITDILPLFAKIGDLAWCYKTDGPTGRTYAIIPRRSFERFQQTIGQFTPDYEVAPIGTLPLHPGEKVEIVTGPLSGREAIIAALEPAEHQAPPTTLNSQPSTLNPQPSTLYRLHLIGDNGIEWRIRLPRQAIKIKN